MEAYGLVGSQRRPYKNQWKPIKIRWGPLAVNGILLGSNTYPKTPKKVPHQSTSTLQRLNGSI